MNFQDELFSLGGNLPPQNPQIGSHAEEKHSLGETRGPEPTPTPSEMLGQNQGSNGTGPGLLAPRDEILRTMEGLKNLQNAPEKNSAENPFQGGFGSSSRQNPSPLGNWSGATCHHGAQRDSSLSATSHHGYAEVLSPRGEGLPANCHQYLTFFYEKLPKTLRPF